MHNCIRESLSRCAFFRWSPYLMTISSACDIELIACDRICIVLLIPPVTVGPPNSRPTRLSLSQDKFQSESVTFIKHLFMNTKWNRRTNRQNNGRTTLVQQYCDRTYYSTQQLDLWHDFQRSGPITGNHQYNRAIHLNTSQTV